MNAKTIREILKYEAKNLYDSGNSYGAAMALDEFRRNATDDQLTRFRELLTQDAPEPATDDPNSVASKHHY